MRHEQTQEEGVRASGGCETGLHSRQNSRLAASILTGVKQLCNKIITYNTSNDSDSKIYRQEVYGNHANAPGNTPEASGNTKNVSGNMPKAFGNTPEAPGNVPGASGNVPEISGNMPEVSGNMTEASGSTPEVIFDSRNGISDVPDVVYGAGEACGAWLQVCGAFRGAGCASRACDGA
jgi:hypothetical protein